MTLAKTERAGTCEDLLAAGPEAPTLCEGWTAHDLAAHLWVRENDPLGAPGIMAKPLAGLTEKRMTEARQRWSYAELVERIRTGPPRLSVFALPGLDEAANGIEYLIHHEDVRRGGPRPQPPRTLDRDTQDTVWKRLRLMGRASFRHAPVGVVLERSDADGDTIRAAPGARTVTLVGLPVELLLYGSGRREAADVQLVGEDVAVQQLRDARLGM